VRRPIDPLLICLGAAYLISFVLVLVFTKGPPWWDNEYWNMIGAAGIGGFATAIGLGVNWWLFARKDSN
jgi:hypothetical protein